MLNRRQFLTHTAALAAVPLILKTGLSAQVLRAAGSDAKLEWAFTGRWIDLLLGSRRIAGGFVPGYQAQGIWRMAENLAVLRKAEAYSDRCGRGTALFLQCKMGAIDGTWLLVTYDDGKVGCRLDLTNPTTSALSLETYSPLMTHLAEGSLELSGHPAEWRLYIDSGRCGGRCASYALNENEGRNDAGGVSVLWSPEGEQSLAVGQLEVERSLTTIAYEYGEKGANNKVYHWAQSRRVQLRLQQDAIGYRLDPGETFSLDCCLLAYSADPFQALTALRDAMVAFNRVRRFTNDDAWVGWMTWYNQESHIRGGFGATGKTSATQAITLEQSRFIAESGLINYGVRDIAIDDGYQKSLHLGDWLEATSEFPQGMEGLARELRKLGLTAAIWLTPFVATEDSPVYREHPDWFVRRAFDWYAHDLPVAAYELDPTAPGALDWLLQVFRTLQKWGYRRFKNDFSGGLIESRGKQYRNRKQTGLMRWRWTWRQIKDALGGDRGCSIQLCGANNLGALGIVDTVRTGSDVSPGVGEKEWGILRDNTATTGINRWWQNKHFFICDPDNLEVAEYRGYRMYADRLDYESKWALSFDEARVRAALVVAVGGNIILGDRLTLLEPERIEIVRKTLPLYGESAIPLDMFEQTVPCLWWHHVIKPWGSWEVLSVVNFGEASLVKEIPLERMKLNPDRPAIAWEFWSQEEHGGIHEGVLRVAVKPHSIKTLRITPYEKDRTTLVGSSFHLVMGALEVLEAKSSGDGSLTVRLGRPAPESGCCAFWSAQKQAVVNVPVKAGPEGTEIRVT